jgi:hypothetical protein
MVVTLPQSGQQPSAVTAPNCTQVVLALYSFVGTFSIGQLELVLNRVLLKLADGGWW